MSTITFELELSNNERAGIHRSQIASKYQYDKNNISLGFRYSKIEKNQLRMIN